MRPILPLVIAFTSTIVITGIGLSAIVIFGFDSISSDAEGSRAVEMMLAVIAFGPLAILSGLALAAILSAVRTPTVEWDRRIAIATGALLGGLSVFAFGTGMLGSFAGRWMWFASCALPGAVAAILVLALSALSEGRRLMRRFS